MPLEHLRTLYGKETAWGRRVILAMVLAIGYARVRKPKEVVLVLGSAARAYRGLMRWVTQHGDGRPPEVLRDFEAACVRALGDLEPPRAAGDHPVARLARVAEHMRRPRRRRPERAMSALDALITVGRSTSTHRFRRRVARELAAMIGARVLFHRRKDRWLTLRPQAEHTLSSWTIHRLSQVRRLRAVRIRPRPEFWRPEQRRPGGLLLVPFEGGTVALARARRFGRRDADAVRTVLRFLDARRSAASAPAAPLVARAGTPPPRPLPLPIGDGLVGRSAPWRDVLRQIRRFAGSSASILLLGETGTGKEQVARALHAVSMRSPHAFVAINCGAITPELMASELFGHIRGAFTGADRSHEGLFVRAHRGTLFLDEVADMPAEMQVALLRVLEERCVRPVGSTRQIPVDVRIVTASARDLADEVARGRFREDLFHRLNVVRIDLPPLRARRDDIPLLAHHLAARTPERASVHPDVLPLLLAHDWPGNVRELDNVLRAAAVLTEGGEITPEIVRGVMAQRRAIRRQVAAGSGVGAPRSAREDSILPLLGDGWVSAADIASRLGVSVRTVNRDLSTLVARGLVDSVGSASARRYGLQRQVDA